MPAASHKTSFRQFCRQRIDGFVERPFGRLVHHFLARLVRGGDASATEFEFGVGGLLAMLAMPGACASFLMIDKYSTFLNWARGRLHQDIYAISLPDKYLFLSLAMAVTGIVTVLKWDKILPDAQDYLNLAPLPVRPRTVFLANAAAIAIAVLVFAIDVNAVSAVMFPFFVVSSGPSTMAALAGFSAVHAAVMVLASVFTFCAVFAVLGLLSALLPRQVFRACSSWLRGGVLIAFIMLLLSSYAGTVFLRRIELHPGSWLRFLPSLWYLGLYQSWQHHAGPLLAGLAHMAVRGLAAAFLLMAASYGLSYRRRFAAAAESEGRTTDQHLFAPLLWFLDLFSARSSGFERACHRFVVRSLLRSETHRILIAVAIGLGWLLAAGEPGGAPLVAAYLLILGLRVAFELPAGVPAGWVFRATLDPRTNETLPVARRVILSVLVPAVLLPALAIAWVNAGFPRALLHTLFLLVLSMGLAEILLAGYRKIPLTCPMPGFQNNFLMLCLIQLVSFEAFTRAGAAMEAWMFGAPLRFLLAPAAILAVWRWNLRRLREAREAGELEEGLTFENVQIPVVERLNLS